MIYSFLPLQPNNDTALSDDDVFLLDIFSRGNVIVFGQKGSGKDLLFQHVINLRAAPYYATQPYGGSYNHVKISDLRPGDNVFDDFLNETTRPFYDKFIRGTDIYISDAGIYFPSWAYLYLDKTYPGLPLQFAISRHCGQHNIHCNCQALGGFWNKLREQGGSYIKCLGAHLVDGVFFVKYRYYAEYNAAASGLLPNLKDAQFVAQNGLIFESFFAIKLKDLRYDTYFFANKLHLNANNNLLAKKIKEFYYV